MGYSKLIEPGKWYKEFDENGNCTAAVYDASYRKLLGFESAEEYADAQKTWTSQIHPDDAERLNAHLADCMARHPEGMDFDIEYRMMTRLGYRRFHDYAHVTRREDGSPMRADGVVFDIQDIVEKTDEHRMLFENNTRILALEDNFEVLYDVELSTGKYDIFVKGQTFSDLNNLINNNSFFDDVEKNLEVVYPEDRQGNYDTTRPEFIREALSKNDHYDRYYRLFVNGKPAWARMRTVYKDAEKKNIIIGVFDAQEEMALREQNEQIISGFAKEYDATFVGNITDGSFRTISGGPGIDALTVGASTLTQLFENLLTKYVHPDDVRPLYESMIDVREIDERLPVGRTESFDYRGRGGDGFSVNRITVTRLSDCEVLAGFKNVEEQVNIEKAQAAISDDYFAIYLVDIDSDTIKVVKRSKSFRPDSRLMSNSYSEIIAGFTDGLTEKNRLKWAGLETAEGLRRYLAEQDKRELLYESAYREGRLSRVTWYVVERADGKAKTVCMAFARLDEEQADRERLNEQIAEQKAKLEETYAFTGFFLDTYISAFYVNLRTREYTMYKEPKFTHGNAFMASPDYVRVISSFAEQAVNEEYTDELLSLIQPEKIKQLLADGENRGQFSYTFRDSYPGSDRYVRMQVVRGADDDHATVGFRDVTEEVTEQQKHLLGAVPISPDILAKENIGMWAFELDEGQPPRMYGDEAMLRLVGLEHQVPPEEMYHAWYDHIDEGSYSLVADAVEKMMSGEHAEVQYPWHHPDGHTMIVRCGGIRNPEYTGGIRVEGTHQNVTEVLHFDEEQIKQRRRMNMIYSLSDEFDPIFVLDPVSGEYDWYESRADEIETLTAMSVHGTDFYRDIETDIATIIHDEDREQFRAVYNRENMLRIAETGEAQETENRWKVGPDGTYLWKYNRLVRMTDEDGKAYVVVGVIDTTEAKEKETIQITNAVLSEYMLQSYTTAYYADLRNGLINILRAPSFVKNAETAFAAQGKALDYDTLIGYYVSSRVHPEDRAEFRKYADRDYTRALLEKDDSFSFIFRDIADYAPGVYRCTVIRGADADHIAAGFQNITEELREQKERQQALEEANASNELVLSFVNGIKWSYYINDNDEITGVRYGESAVESYDVGDSADPMEWVSLVHPDDRDDVVRAFSDTIRDRSGKKQVDMTYRLMGTDGSYHWTRISGRVFPREDGTRELFGISIDVSDQMEKEREQQQQLAEALSMAESANRAKTTFLNNMSHDIRTPMNAIIGYTGLAAGHIDNRDQVQDYLSKIAQSSGHLLSLINDVLDMSRIESGKMNLEEKPENLPSIVHTLRDIIQADIHAKQHDFFIDTVNVRDENIICDKLRLNQVLLNILSNAIKYTPQGGTVSMRITEKTVKPSGYATYEFCIKDNGMGMDKEYLKTLFDPFTRVKSSTVSGIQGTGLGMAITKNIIDMMAGTIDVQSESGKGTEITVTFDFKLQEVQKQSIAIAALEGMRGLVVDDDANTSMSVASMLREVGMRPDWCVSGKEAVLRAEYAYKCGDSFRVFIIDWMMPDMNGIETTRRIRRVIGDDTPIIILTAYDWSDIEDEAREAGVTAFVSKPLFPSDLTGVLNRCLGTEDDRNASPSVEYDFRGKKILLVEDNEMNREIACEILSEDGFEVRTAEDGDIAVEIMRTAETGDYDLILMDIQMPRMDGYEATREIRALGTEISSIPILAMTANAFEEDRKLALEAGMNEHISKPIDIEKLKETLAKFLK